MFDTHCHLDVREFDADRDAVLARARSAGITDQLIPAITRAHWAGIQALCEQETGLYPAFGLHPMYLSEHQESDILALEAQLQDCPSALVGECGLDFYVQDVSQAQQVSLLSAQLRLARDFSRPAILHGRRAFDALLVEVRRAGVRRGIVHSFAGSLEQAQAFVKQGFLLGIGGPITYPRAQRLQRVCQQIPLEHIVLETDSPDQPICGFQGQRNEPAQLVHVVDALAELLQVAPAKIISQTTFNARALLSFSGKRG